MYRSRVSYETKLERDEEGTRSKKEPAEPRDRNGEGGDERAGSPKRKKDREAGRKVDRESAKERTRGGEVEEAGRNLVRATERTTTTTRKVRTPTGRQARHIQLALPRVLGQLTSSSSAGGVT